MRCPNCGFEHVRHKGEKVREVTKDSDGKKHIKAYNTEKGYTCKKCGWKT